MSDNIINGIQGLGKKKQIQQASQLMPHGVNRIQQQAPQVNQAPRGDQVNISDEVRENDKLNPVNVDALKDSIASIKNQIAAKPSGKDATPDLVNDAFAVQMERNGLSGAKAPTEGLGLKPGMHSGSVIGANGIQGGPEKGMGSGGVYSSRRSNSQGYQPGGGTATPNMVKMETDYAGAIKEGARISPEGEDMVLQNMANSGVGAQPIRSMLGI